MRRQSNEFQPRETQQEGTRGISRQGSDRNNITDVTQYPGAFTSSRRETIGSSSIYERIVQLQTTFIDLERRRPHLFNEAERLRNEKSHLETRMRSLEEHLDNIDEIEHTFQEDIRQSRESFQHIELNTKRALQKVYDKWSGDSPHNDYVKSFRYGTAETARDLLNELRQEIEKDLATFYERQNSYKGGIKAREHDLDQRQIQFEHEESEYIKLHNSVYGNTGDPR